MAVRSIIGYECVHVIGRAVACKTGAVIAAVRVVTLSVIATDSTQLTLIFICKTGYHVMNRFAQLQKPHNKSESVYQSKTYSTQDNQTLAISPSIADKSIHAVAHFPPRSVSFIITGSVLMARGTNIPFVCLHSYI